MSWPRGSPPTMTRMATLLGLKCSTPRGGLAIRPWCSRWFSRASAHLRRTHRKHPEGVGPISGKLVARADRHQPDPRLIQPFGLDCFLTDTLVAEKAAGAVSQWARDR